MTSSHHLWLIDRDSKWAVSFIRIPIQVSLVAKRLAEIVIWIDCPVVLVLTFVSLRLYLIIAMWSGVAQARHEKCIHCKMRYCEIFVSALRLIDGAWIFNCGKPIEYLPGDWAVRTCELQDVRRFFFPSACQKSVETALNHFDVESATSSSS